MTDNPTADDVQPYLDRIVAAGMFEAGSLRYRLLDHLIREELAGRGDTLKAYCIGVDVFEKPDSFDPSTDSSIRVGIGRLRTALALFEASPQADTPFTVEVPVGTYRPILRCRQSRVPFVPPASPQTDHVPQEASNDGAAPRRLISKVRALWALAGFALGILALGLFSFGHMAAPMEDAIAIEIDVFDGDPVLAARATTSLRRSLSRSQTIKVIAGDGSADIAAGADFVLNGTVTRSMAGKVDVAVELTNAQTNSIVWATARQLSDDALLQTRIAQTLGSELRIRAFGATKRDLASRDPETLTPEQLFIMATWVPGQAENAVEWELERVRLMGKALEIDPDFGAAHSVIADKLSYLASVYGPSNTEELRMKALVHAQRARELAPLNPDVMFNVAQALWHSGQHMASKAAMDRVLDLDANHDLARFLGTLIPYTCSTPPDDVVDWAIAFDDGLSKDNPIRWLTLTWISWMLINQGDYARALEAEEESALIFEAPHTFMRRALLLHKFGRTEEAAAVVNAQQTNWPGINADFFAQVTQPRLCTESPDHPHLIQNYVDLAQALRGKT